MNKLTTTLLSALFVAAAGSAMAQDSMKKDAMMKKPTLQQCKDHMAMQKKEGMDATKKDAMKKDDAMAKMEKSCSEMISKDGTPKDATTK